MSRIWLYGAVTFVVALVVGGLVVALVTNRDVDLMPEDTPEGVLQRYLIALKDEEYEEAYGYLSREQRDRCTLSEFFSRAPRTRVRDSRVTLADTQTFGDTAIVRAEITTFEADVPFGSSEYSRDRNYSLRLEAGEWRLEEPHWWCPPDGY